MKVLVVGSGGREHALAWKLSQECEVVCSPGNPGIGRDVELAPVAASDSDGIIRLAKAREIDLVVVGPEDPLIAGLADSLREEGLSTFGPSASGARLEGSKAFSKALMAELGISTAAHRSFQSAEAARAYASELAEVGKNVVIKASGNALGKGVVVCDTKEQAEAAIVRMMEDKEFGEAAETVVVEERLVGREFSLLTMIGDQNFVSLPVAQDYKRVFDEDRGPNTGGMGGYSPCDWVSSETVENVERSMVQPIFQWLKSNSITFRGTLFTGVMVTDNGPLCLEYNVRFGDPETQSIMMRLEDGFSEALHQAATGGRIEAPKVSDRSAATIVVASEGYPGAYRRGLPIQLRDSQDNVKIFFAGVAESYGRLVTAGGRVAAVSATGPSVEAARQAALAAAASVSFEGAFYRRDIAKQKQ